MTTKCRFSTCKWIGEDDDIFTHCEEFHRNCIKEHKNRNYYDFTFDDLTREAFLLCRPDGIYWFCLNLENDADARSESIKRSIFHIGDSPPIQYTLKFGLIRDGHADYYGPYESCGPLPEDFSAEAHEVEWELDYVTAASEGMPSRSFRLYVGEFDDSDDSYVPHGNEIEPWQEEDAQVNVKCLEMFTCPICYEYIRRDPRFCERKHFICTPCFETLERRKKLRCPVCRECYPYDCYDARINDLLKMVQFPSQNDASPSTSSSSTSKNAQKHTA